MRLVACPSCSQHIKLDEPDCHHCGAHLRSDTGMIGRTASAVLLGLSMTACPADDSSSDTGASNSESNTMTAGDTTGSASASASGSMTSAEDGSTTFIGEPEYGVGETTFAETTGGSDSTSLSGGTSSSSSGAAESTSSTTGDSSSTTGFNSGEPEYGVPLTSDTGVVTTGVEPEYGVPEPDYGVPE